MVDKKVSHTSTDICIKYIPHEDEQNNTDIILS